RPLAREAGAPKDAPTVAHRQWEMTTTSTGRDAWRDTARTWVVYVALSRPSARDPWRLSGVVVHDGG
ncbi:hypothetical protein ACFQ07_11045, partial [Actinomadura adrarensis]